MPAAPSTLTIASLECTIGMPIELLAFAIPVETKSFVESAGLAAVEHHGYVVAHPTPQRGGQFDVVEHHTVVVAHRRYPAHTARRIDWRFFEHRSLRTLDQHATFFLRHESRNREDVRCDL